MGIFDITRTQTNNNTQTNSTETNTINTVSSSDAGNQNTFDYNQLLDLLAEKGIDELYKKLQELEAKGIVKELVSRTEYGTGKPCVYCVYNDVAYEFVEVGSKSSSSKIPANLLTSEQIVSKELKSQISKLNLNFDRNHTQFLNKKISFDNAKDEATARTCLKELSGYVEKNEAEIEKLKEVKEKLEKKIDLMSQYEKSYSASKSSISKLKNEYNEMLNSVTAKLQTMEAKLEADTNALKELQAKLDKTFSQDPEVKTEKNTAAKAPAANDDAAKDLGSKETNVDFDIAETPNPPVEDKVDEIVIENKDSVQKTNLDDKKAEDLNNKLTKLFDELKKMTGSASFSDVEKDYSNCLKSDSLQDAEKYMNKAASDFNALENNIDKINSKLDEIKSVLAEVDKLKENLSDNNKQIQTENYSTYNKYCNSMISLNNQVAKYSQMESAMRNHIVELSIKKAENENVKYNADGTISSRNNCDKNGNVVSVSTFTYNSKTGEVIEEIKDLNNKLIEKVTQRKDGTKTSSVYNAEKLVSTTNYDTKGNVTTKVEFTSEVKNGIKYEYETTSSGDGKKVAQTIKYASSAGEPIVEERKYDKDGKTIIGRVATVTSNDKVSVKNYRSDNIWLLDSITETYKDGKVLSYKYDYQKIVDTNNYEYTRTCSNGDKYSETKVNGKKTVSSSYNKEQNKTYTNYYNNDEKVTQAVTQEHSTGNKYTYTYTTPGNKNDYNYLVEYKNGNWESQVVKNGKKVSGYQYDASLGRVVTMNYDNNGNRVTAKSKLTGSLTKSGITLSAQEIYNGITNLDATLFRTFLIPWTGADCVNMIAGKLSLDLLRKADKDYKGAPTYKAGQYPAQYKDFLQTYLEKACSGSSGCKGYKPEMLKGYKYESSSSLSQAITSYTGKIIAGGKTYNGYREFIKAYKDNLDNLPSSISFEEDDLYYGLHGVTIAPGAYKDANGKVHITFADVYDFDGNAKGDSGGALLNRVGAAAMEDGELIPYYLLIDVVS